ncbi:MAG: FlgD immunoglobulin-like domain containing protein [Candidatus Krumholzibacteriia bacterium]
MRQVALSALLTLVAVAIARADGDAGTFARLGFDDRPQVCLFQDTVALRGEYADRGLVFGGPAARDGGGVLTYCSFFLVVGWTPPNLVGFNEAAAYSDGGIPRGPQTIVFDAPVNFVEADVGAAIEVGYPATMTAFDAAGVPLTSATVALDRETRPLLVEAPGIARVVVDAPGARFILDDLLWGESAGGDLTLQPAALAVTLTAGSQAARTVSLRNGAGHPLEFFVQERPGAPVAARAAPRTADLALAGDPVTLANLREPRTMQPVRYRSSDRGGRDLALLVYSEFDPDDFNYDTDLDQALRSLDIPYTAVYANIPVFRAALQEQAWDAVIFDHQLAFLYEPDLAVYDELLTHVRAGGRLIMSTWQIADRPLHPLWSELGFRWLENYEGPEPVVWTPAEPRFFTVPNDVPDFTELGTFYVTHGHRIAALPGATVLARLLPRGQDTPAMVLANGGRTLYRAFMDGANVVDRDGDQVLDTIELWRDLLVQMLADDVPWLGATVEGAVPAGGTVDLEVVCDADDLAPGDYTAHLELRTNEAVRDTYRLPVALTVIDDPTSVADAPAADDRLRAYPNPFNPATTLSFTLDQPGPVSLHLHDARGRRIRTMLDRVPLAAGSQAVRWDGRDDAGRAAAAGVYLARLATAGRVLQERLVLVR